MEVPIVYSVAQLTVSILWFLGAVLALTLMRIQKTRVLGWLLMLALLLILQLRLIVLHLIELPSATFGIELAGGGAAGLVVALYFIGKQYVLLRKSAWRFLTRELGVLYVHTLSATLLVAFGLTLISNAVFNNSFSLLPMLILAVWFSERSE